MNPIKISKKDNDFAQYGAIGLAIVAKFTHDLPREYTLMLKDYMFYQLIRRPK